MKLSKVAGCEFDNCPVVYLSDAGMAVVQGFPVRAADGLELGVGEIAVEVPPEIVLASVEALQGAKK
ncbi:hypothetical protein QFW96_12500 [Saccharopolyspora sp. TS4A08]|uniref:Uncharacterized protein n=1 Tax=Saccharopolyspora ipomoeae TaxID=3042027 RepID=A0ABT6PPS1_9PSEU|nr:hypothetical protein [Saccharopolyspora sp. TS4A08]MDI2029441.1 hypothetical protein [Saccharopolyspora sp. TS4A08]